MPHDHVHNHGPPTSSSRALAYALVLSGGFLLVEAAVGFVSGSLALLSDATHMVSDVAALLLALVASRVALRPATPNQTFGLVRAEAVGALVNALFLLLACVLIAREAIERLLGEPAQVSGWPVLVTGVLGLGVNLLSAWLLTRSGGDNLNVRAALTHVMADALGSLGAVAAAVSMLAFGFEAADAIASVGIALLVLRSTWVLLKDTLRVLLQFAPAHVDVPELEQRLRSLEGVSSVHELHVWSLDGEQAVVSAHVVTEPGAAPRSVLLAAEELLGKEYGISHTTLQVEDGMECHQGVCPARRAPTAGHDHAGHSHS